MSTARDGISVRHIGHISVVALGLSLSSFFAISFLACILLGLIVPDAGMHHAPVERSPAITELLESRLSDFGVDVAPTAERLAGFHRVEYTYLSTFQMLGGLGLVLGTLGLGAVLLRNVLERRKELAVMRALGYTHRDFLTMVVAENVLLLIGGLTIGTFCALLAIAPVFLDRGGRLPIGTLTVLLLGVLGTGLLASLGATAAALRSPLLTALRNE